MDISHITTDEFGRITELLRAGELDAPRAAEEMFSHGYRFEREGSTQLADQIYSQASELIEELHLESESLVCLRGLGKLARRHGIALVGFSRLELARITFQRSLECFDEAVRHDTDTSIALELASTLHWLAFSERQTGLHVESLMSYRRTISLWRNVIMFVPSGSQQFQVGKLFGATLQGYAKALDVTGHTTLAEFYRKRGVQIIKNCMRMRTPVFVTQPPSPKALN